MNRSLETPPIPIKSVRKQEDTNVEQTETQYNIIEPVNIVSVYEIWKVYLEKNKDELDHVFIIISADCILEGYRNAVWSNIEYEGFYTTIEEAQNQISGYIR